MSAHQQSLTTLLVTYRDAGRLLGLSESMIKKMVRLGTIDVVKIGRAARVPVSELTRIVELKEEERAPTRRAQPINFRGNLDGLAAIRRKPEEHGA